jgi:YHS domain-containing protein
MLTRILFLVAAFAFSGVAAAQKPEVFSDSGAAIRGYDPVAYFTSGKPVKGSKEFTTRWRGATWHFASAENRDRFAAAPEKYAPQYGGYCAYGVSQGYTVSIDPAAWTVVDGKLYLNYSTSVRRTWEKDIPGYIRKADVNWPRALER